MRLISPLPLLLVSLAVTALPAGEAPGAGAPTTPPAAAGPPAPVTEKEIAALTWDEVTNDSDFVSPFAHNFDSLKESDERRKDWDAFTDKLDAWGPGKVPNPGERSRNLISVAALMDVGEGQFESETPLLIYQRLTHELTKEQLTAVLAEIVFHPEIGSVVTTAPELDLNVGVGDERVRERVQVYAKKMLGRVLGKLPVEPQ
jgi:hypothetical protein